MQGGEEEGETETTRPPGDWGGQGGEREEEDEEEEKGGEGEEKEEWTGDCRGGGRLLSQQVPSTHGETGSNPSFLPMHLLEIRYWQVSQLDWFRT